jgi:hypothetical protein
MRSILRRCRRGHAAAAAYTALFLALGGTAYAAATITSEDIVDETIQSEDIAAQAVGTDEIGTEAVTLDRLHGDSVTGTKVADGTLWGVDVRNASLTGSDVADNSLTGADLNLDIRTVGAETWEPDAKNPNAREVSVDCPDGYSPLSGGATVKLRFDTWEWRGFEDRFDLADSSPKVDPNSVPVGWTARAVTDSTGRYYHGDDFGLYVYAICAKL